MHSAAIDAGDTSRSLSEQRQSYDWCSIAICIVLVCLTARRWPHGIAGLGLLQDDFFYYEKIATSIATGHGSTFNHVTITNGYHPLWMCVLIPLCFLLHNHQSTSRGRFHSDRPLVVNDVLPRAQCFSEPERPSLDR